MDSRGGRSSRDFEELEMHDISPSTSDKHSISPLSRVSTHSATQLPPETDLDDVILTTDLGAWSRYPSHTRGKRTGSAGAADNIIARDFALELHVQSADASDIDSEADATTSKQFTVKKRRSNMSKSRSLNLPKEFIKNYARMFKSQSQEFLGHGHGHRTSISAGGLLSHPELEILPDMWAPLPLNKFELADIHRRPSPMDDEATDTMGKTDGQIEDDANEATNVAPSRISGAKSNPMIKLKAKLTPKYRKSTDALRPGQYYDGVAESKPDLQGFIQRVAAKCTKNAPQVFLGPPIDQARLWSQMYESCVEHPRFSTEEFDSDAPEKVMDVLLAASIAEEYRLALDSAQGKERQEKKCEEQLSETLEREEEIHAESEYCWSEGAKSKNYPGRKLFEGGQPVSEASNHAPRGYQRMVEGFSEETARLLRRNTDSLVQSFDEDAHDNINALLDGAEGTLIEG